MTTVAVDRIFVDTNVLVYANIGTSPWHEAAQQRLNALYAAGSELWISQQVIREFIVVLSRPQTFAAPQPISVILQRVAFLEQNFQIAQDGPDVLSHLKNLLSQLPIGGKRVHDANLVATMLQVGVSHLLTHNVSDFQVFGSFIQVLPLNP